MQHTNRNIGEQFSNFDEDKECFQGIENMSDEYIGEVKEYIATYILYNVKYEDVEARKQAINEAFAKICIYCELKDMPLNEGNIASKENNKELAAWIAKSKEEIEKIMEIQENQNTSAPQEVIKTMTSQSTEKAPCKCQEHASAQKMTLWDCLPLALLGIGVAYFLFSSLKMFYYAAAAIVVIFVGSLYYNKWKEKKAKEAAEEV